MISISYPPHQFKIKTTTGKEIIFDECRKTWVTLSPEEWVRQNFLQYLIQVMKYPHSLIAVEREISLGDTKKRFDIVVYKDSKPWMIIECKEKNVPLSEAVITQILNYNITLQVQYLVITNGDDTHGLHLLNGRFSWIEKLPEFQ
jgi:hypothetical protein